MFVRSDFFHCVDGNRTFTRRGVVKIRQMSGKISSDPWSNWKAGLLKEFASLLTSAELGLKEATARVLDGTR